MADDAGEGILFVGEDGAAVEAGGIGAVIAGGRDGLGEGVGAVAADEEADVAPGFVVVEAVEGVAGGDAGFAAGVGVECDPEGVLFAGAGMGERDEGLEILDLRYRMFDLVERMAGADDGGLQAGLLGEEFVDEGEGGLLFFGATMGQERDVEGGRRPRPTFKYTSRW